MPDGQIFTPATTMEVAIAALTGALNSNTDAVGRLAEHSNLQDGKLDTIMETLGDMKTRLTLIERTPISARIDKLELKSEAYDKLVLKVETLEELKPKIEILEDEAQQRKGQRNLLDWSVKNWPGVLGFFALIVTVLVATGKIHF